MSPLAVVALGGNALVTDADHQAIPDQYDAVRSVAGPLVELVAAGLGPGRQPRQRPAGRLHPAALGAGARPSSRRSRWTTPSATRRAPSATCSSRRSATSCAAGASSGGVAAIVTQTVVDPGRPGVRAPDQAGRLVPRRRDRARARRAPRLARRRGRRARLAAGGALARAGRDRRAARRSATCSRPGRSSWRPAAAASPSCATTTATSRASRRSSTRTPPRHCMAAELGADLLRDPDRRRPGGGRTSASPTSAGSTG